MSRFSGAGVGDGGTACHLRKPHGMRSICRGARQTKRRSRERLRAHRRISLNRTPPWLSRSAPTRRFHRHRLERDGKILHHRIGDVFHQHTLLIERAPLDGVDIERFDQFGRTNPTQEPLRPTWPNEANRDTGRRLGRTKPTGTGRQRGRTKPTGQVDSFAERSQRGRIDGLAERSQRGQVHGPWSVKSKLRWQPGVSSRLFSFTGCRVPVASVRPR